LYGRQRPAIARRQTTAPAFPPPPATRPPSRNTGDLDLLGVVEGVDLSAFSGLQRHRIGPVVLDVDPFADVGENAAVFELKTQIIIVAAGNQLDRDHALRFVAVAQRVIKQRVPGVERQRGVIFATFEAFIGNGAFAGLFGIASGSYPWAMHRIR
jgi:hypothetical protein